MSARIKTDLPPGHYCDVTSGLFTNDTCKGRLVTVDSTGYVYVNLPDTKDSTMALHIQVSFNLTADALFDLLLPSTRNDTGPNVPEPTDFAAL